MIVYDYLEIECKDCGEVFESWTEYCRDHSKHPKEKGLKVSGWFKENPETVITQEVRP